SSGRSSGGTRRRRAAPRRRASTVDLGGDDIDDILEGLFGSRFGAVGGAEQEAEIEIPIEAAYRGGKRRIQLSNGRSLEVTIPRGVRNGQRIRLAGQGGEGFGGGPAGDLYLIVRIAPHPHWRLEGRDLYADLPLAPWEAALGTTVAVSVPDGDAKVLVPPGTSSGQRIRVPGRGLPRRSGAPGDLIAEVRIVVPSTLTDEERRLFEQLSRVSHFDPRRES
ncbi:MAG: heat shock protein DnaJ protein, partial [Acidimicrobiaceae bacterium]|nr:heat shock protein DnaJ protein [Acidimicrobiaceae bacterium]